MATDYAVVGRVRKPHGLRGELVVELFTDTPDVVFTPGRRLSAGTADAAPSGAEYEVTHGRPFKDTWLVTLRGIADRDTADSLRDVYLIAPLSELPQPDEDEFYLHELVGLSAQLPDGSVLGPVERITEMPHGVLLEVRTARGITSVPFVEPIVVDIDRDTRIITIDPPDGLLDL